MVRLAGDGRLSVVGESHYQPALKVAARGRTVAEGDLDNAIPVNAVLVPEPKNKYDRNAVRVDVEGRTAGYVSRETAVLYQPVLLQLQAESKLGWCPGRIMGGGRRSYGIYLHMSPPEALRLKVPLTHELVSRLQGVNSGGSHGVRGMRGWCAR